jgi:hypothetical protein
MLHRKNFLAMRRKMANHLILKWVLYPGGDTQRRPAVMFAVGGRKAARAEE